MTDDPWDGSERRATDKRFAAAMNDVRALKVGVAELAEAVAVRTTEFQKVVRQVAVLLIALLLVLLVNSFYQVGRLSDRLDRGHATIACLLLTEPAGRTAQTLLDCQKGGR